MRHFLSSLALAAALTAPAPILAQNLFEPVVYINNAAITRYEVEQRQRFMQILGNPGTTAEEAQQALTRLQRRLSASLFMHDGREVFVKFSGGVTDWRVGEAAGLDEKQEVERGFDAGGLAGDLHDQLLAAGADRHDEAS